MTETEFNFKLRLLKAIEKDQELMDYVEKNTYYPDADDFEDHKEYDKMVDYAEIETIVSMLPDFVEYLINAKVVYSMAKEWDDEFQNYVDNDGKPIPEGYPIGFEIGDKLYLFDGVRFG